MQNLNAKMTENIWQSVHSIVASGVIAKGSTQENLLTYLIEKNLSNDINKLQPFSIGVDVLRKDESFDPSQDSRVRVEMYRLRQSLSSYYSTPKSDPVKIEFPKGGYTARFSTQPTNNQTQQNTCFDNSNLSDTSTSASDIAKSTPANFTKIPTHFLIGIAIICLSIVLAAQVTKNFYNKEPLKENVTPIIRIHSDSHFQDEKLEDIVKFIESSTVNNWMIRTSQLSETDNSFDYVLKLSHRDNNIYAVATDKNKQLVHSIEFSNKNTTDKMGIEIYQFFFNQLNGAIIRHHAHINPTSPKTTLYRCFIDTLEVTYGRSPKFGNYSNTLGCLNTDLTTIPHDQAIIHRLRFFHHINLVKDFINPEKNLVLAKNEFINQTKVGFNPTKILSHELALMELDPSRTKAALHRLLDGLENSMEFDLSTKYQIMAANALYLGNWEKTHKLLNELGRGLESSNSSISIYIVAEQISEENFSLAEQYFKNTTHPDSLLYATFGLSIACQSNDASKITAISALIQNTDLFRGVDFLEYVKFRNLEEKLHLSLSKTLQQNNCPYSPHQRLAI